MVVVVAERRERDFERRGSEANAVVSRHCLIGGERLLNADAFGVRIWKEKNLVLSVDLVRVGFGNF